MSWVQGARVSHAPAAMAAILLFVSFRGTGAADCNNNSHADAEEIGWLSPDCNANGIPDDCDVAPGPRFEAPEMELGGRPPESALVTGVDLDGDGDLDIAGTYYGIHLYWNDGDGTFTRVTDLLEGVRMGSIQAGDLDGDGDQDLATLREQGFPNPNVVTILLQGSGGDFLDPVDVPMDAIGAGVFALGDLDADGLQEVVVGRYSLDGEDLAISFGMGSGVFGPPVPFHAGNSPRQIIATDLDGDQRQDLAVASDSGVNVLWNEGDRAFVLSEVIPTSYHGPAAVHAADLDGDGDVDLAVGHRGTAKTAGGISLLRNAGGRALAEAEAVYPPLISESISGADLDGDGDVDLASGPGELTVLLNAGDGSLEDWMSYGPNVGSLQSIFCADVDGDGDADVGGGGPIYFRNRGNGTFAGEMRLQTFGTPHVTVDLDGDGDTDVVSETAILINSGGGTFKKAASLLALGIAPVAAGDLDGDLVPDVVARRRDDVAILLNAGGELGPPLAIGAGPIPVWAAAGDMDGDGDLDVAAAYHAGDAVGVLENLGGGAFSPLQTVAVDAHPLHVAVGDVNGDGLPDLVTANQGATLLYEDDSLSLVLHRGEEGFGVARTLVMGGGLQRVALADLEGDADIDLAAARTAGETLSVLLNPGGGSFEGPVDYPMNPGPFDVVAVDLDGDGDVDLAAAHWGQLSWLLNDGSGVFGGPSPPRYGPAARYITTADLEGDGDADLVTSGLVLAFHWNITDLPASQDCNRNGVPDECEAAPCAHSPFVRGDANDSGAVDISDAIFTLDHLFLGTRRATCLGALDANADRQADITDAIYTLQFLFTGGLEIPPPYPACGTDEARESLSCALQTHCG